GWRLLAGGLPQEAAEESVTRRLPEVETRGPCESVIQVPHVRMTQLVDVERVLVVLRRGPQVLPNRVPVAVVVRRVVGGPVELVQQEAEHGDLEGRDEVAPVGSRLPIEHGGGGRRRLLCGARMRAGEDDQDEAEKEGRVSERPTPEGPHEQATASGGAPCCLLPLGATDSVIRSARETVPPASNRLE